MAASTLAAGAVRHAAEDSDALIGLHLDHADTLDELSAAINAGFGSLMIDGSTMTFDRHVTLAQSAKGLATWSRLPLEAELGHVAGDEAGVTIGDPSWTDPDEAARFVEATAVDWLAVAVGNTHGGPAAAGLQVDRLRAICEAVSIPLVLHGASGLTDDELAIAVEPGRGQDQRGHVAASGSRTASRLAQSLSRQPGNLRAALIESERAVEAEAARLLTASWAVR